MADEGEERARSDGDEDSGPASLPTGTAPRGRRSGPPSSGSSASGVARGAGERFVAGDVLDDRYRILGLLGRGGMGEVYRADDLLLDQPVALKFLPPGLEADPDRLRRFYSEVRLAQQVTHPSVCRIHDVRHSGGTPYLSMELVDGEDLGSLLRRIGRLSGDKALEMARQLAMGLAAAHEKGVLHRDLKPANVMIDGRGRVRITDFGLAAIAETIEDADVRSGTPAYMSPEQLAGRGVTPASDIYALGLVLYELFTGRRAFEGRSASEIVRAHAASDVVRPSSIVSDIDPGVENAILRCLERDADRRPGSALAVAAAIPGSDPLAAAVAAGETPSPELVAAAGETQALTLGRASAGLAIAMLGLVALPLLGSGNELIQRVPLDMEPAVLENHAREIRSSLGYDTPPVDSKGGILRDFDYLAYVAARDGSPDRWKSLATGRPPVFFYWYRESPRPLLPSEFVVAIDIPPRVDSGMLMVLMDGQGRLVEFSAVPPQVDDPAAAPVVEPEWSAAFRAAGLDVADFEPVAPRWSPQTLADSRAAWVGVYPDRPDLKVRVEAAGYRGRLVYFQLLGEWSRAWRMQPFTRTRGQNVAGAIAVAMLILTTALSMLLARRNWRLGRGDRRGAARLAFFVFIVGYASLWLQSDHAWSTELALLRRVFGTACLQAFVIWVLYLAIEPYVRRHWPHRLIAWTRLLGGGWRDPLVGRDVLVGTCVGAGLACLFGLYQWLPVYLGGPPAIPESNNLTALLGARQSLSAILDYVVQAVSLGMGVMVLLALLRLGVRRDWLAAAIVIGLMTARSALSGTLSPWVAIPFWAIFWSIPTLAALRYGLLTLVTGMFVALLVVEMPLTSRVDHWTFASTAWTMTVVLLVAFWGFRASLGKTSVLDDRLIDA